MTDPTPAITEAAIMNLLAYDALTWRDIQELLPGIHPDWVDGAMIRLERCGAIHCGKDGRYRRYD